MEDWQLLREYVEKRSEPPFSKLVDRYLDVVYSSALRRLGSHQAAQDVTQSVFSLLAQKAPQIPSGTPLIGWLYRTVKFKALEYSRAEQRRQHYEKEAAAMMDPLPDQQEIWSDVVPHLEKAMDALPPDDQLALLLKYFQHQPFAVIGRTLKVSEDAARMRVNRAQEKLRSLLAKQGITASAGTLATLLAENAVQSSPASAGPLVCSMASKEIPRISLLSSIVQIIIPMAKAKYLSMGATILLVMVALIISLNVYNRSPSSSPLPGNSPEENPQIASPSRPPWAGDRAAITPLPAAEAPEEDLLQEMRLMLYSPVEQPLILSQELSKIIQRLKSYSGSSLQRLRLELMAAIRNPNETIQARAICGLQLLRQDAQEAVSILMDMIESEDFPSPLAFQAILVISPKAETLEKCIRTAPWILKDDSAFSSAISEMAAHHRAAIPEAQKVLEPYLQAPDEDIRFTIALTLVHWPISDKSVIASILSAALKDGSKAIAAVQSLPACGDPAREALPALQELLVSTPDALLKQLAQESLVKIAPELGADQPELSAQVQDLANAEALIQKIERGQATVDELVQGLDSIKSRDRAVFALGKLGPKAVSALPALKHCLERYDRDPQTAHVMGFEKDFIATAIKQIDPNSPKPLFTSNELMPSMRAVSEFLAAHHVTEEEEWRQKINSQMRKNFWTPAQIVGFAGEIGGIDSALRRQFVSKVLEIDPAMEAVLNSKLRPVSE